MSKKIQIRAAAPHCLSMSPEARETIESGQKAFQERQQAAKEKATPSNDGVVSTPPERDYDGEIVKQAIAMTLEQQTRKAEAEAQRRLNQRRILAQVAGIPESQVDLLYGQQ